MDDLTKIQGVGPGTVTKLSEAGIYSIISLATRTPRQLIEVIGGSETASRKLIAAARDMCKLGFESGTNIEQKESETKYIPTYCPGIDKLLGGGLELGTTMEVYAPFASGKSCIAHLLAVSTIKNFPDSYIYWIDCENTYRTSRIKDFCKGLEVDPDHVLAHIKVGTAITSDHQILLTENVEGEISKGLDVKLIIIDSLTNHFRAEYLGRGTLAARQQMLNGYLHKIGKLADVYDLAVYMTNQVQANPALAFGDPNKPVGGNIVGHFSTTRLALRKMGQNKRKMLLVDSPNLPPGETVFAIETEKLTEVIK